MPANQRRQFLRCQKHKKERNRRGCQYYLRMRAGRAVVLDVYMFGQSREYITPLQHHRKIQFWVEGVLAWGGIILGCRMNFHVFQRRSESGVRYCAEINLFYLRLFRGVVGRHFLFTINNAFLYRTAVLEKLFESEDNHSMY